MPGGGSLSKHLLGGSERVSELRWRRRLERNVASLPEGMTRKREEKVERVPHVNKTTYTHGLTHGLDTHTHTHTHTHTFRVI